MSRYQFAQGNYIAYRGCTWHIDNLNTKTKVLTLRRQNDGQIASMPMEEAVELLMSEALAFVSYEQAKKINLDPNERVMADYASKPAERPFRNGTGTFLMRGWMVGPDVIPGRCSNPCRRHHVDANHPCAA